MIHCAPSDKVYVLLLADGVTSRDAKANINSRNTAAINAAQVLSVEFPKFLSMPDNRLDTMALLDIVKPIEKVIDKLQPNIVYTHHGGDLNIDHSLTHRAVMTACRPVPGQSVTHIYAFEVLSSTEWGTPGQDNVFCPTHYIEITDYLTRKFKALDCYDEEMRPYPHARSHDAVEALARLRGCQVGLTAAEAFSVLRQIETTT